MTPAERKSLAEQILDNPMFNVVFKEMEGRAIEQMVNAPNDELRAEGAMRVKAIRSFREDCEAALRNTQERKGAPA